MAMLNYQRVCVEEHQLKFSTQFFWMCFSNIMFRSTFLWYLSGRNHDWTVKLGKFCLLSPLLGHLGIFLRGTAVTTVQNMDVKYTSYVILHINTHKHHIIELHMYIHMIHIRHMIHMVHMIDTCV